MKSNQYRKQHQFPKESSRMIHVLYLTHKRVFSLGQFPFATSTSSQQLGLGSAIPSQLPQHMHQTTDGGGHQAFFGQENESKSPQQCLVCLVSTRLLSILHLKEEVPVGAQPASLSLFLTTPKSNLPKPRCSAQLISITNRIYHCHVQDSLCWSCWRLKRYFLYSFHLFNKHFSGYYVPGIEHAKTKK